MEDNSQVYDTPTLQQEAEANGIEIMESSTDQIQYDDNEGVPPVETEGEEPSTNTEENAEEGEESTAGGNKEEGEKDLQEEVDKHSKAVSSIKENKNLLCVLNAFICIQDKLPNVNLYLVGDMNNNNFGKINIVENGKADTLLRISWDMAKEISQPEHQGGQLFTDYTSLSGLNFRHMTGSFVDFKFQPLLL